MTLMVAGSALTVWAQLAMGASWRIGYDPSERTALVTRGPFRFVRNPIYIAMLVTMIGLALALPNAVSAGAGHPRTCTRGGGVPYAVSTRIR